MNQIDSLYLRNPNAFAILNSDGRIFALGYGAARLCRGQRIVPLPFAGKVVGVNHNRFGRPQRYQG